MGTDKMLSSTLAQQPWPALKKVTARPFLGKGFLYWGYKSSLLPSTALLCSSPSEFASTHLQLIHPSHTVRLGVAGSQISLLSSCTFIPEISVQKFLNGSGRSQTSNTALIQKAARWETGEPAWTMSQLYAAEHSPLGQECHLYVSAFNPHIWGEMVYESRLPLW